jgi:hypothetical protein
MKNMDIDRIEHILGRRIGLDLSLNDLRILVSCFNAVAYWAEIDEKAYLDPDGWKLKERLEGLYRDELDAAEISDNKDACLCMGE